jgi:hypothetical protein
MTYGKSLIAAGGLLLLIGLVTAFWSARYVTRVMGNAGLGVAVWAPERGSLAWQKREQLRARADFWFYVGIVLTACGVVLQTIGGILPLK